MKFFLLLLSLGLIGYFVLSIEESSNGDATLSYENYLSGALARAYADSESVTQSYSSSWDISEMLGDSYTQNWKRQQEQISGTQWDQRVPSSNSENSQNNSESLSLLSQERSSSAGNFGDPGAIYVRNSQYNQDCSGLLFDPCIILDVDIPPQGGLGDIVRSYEIDI